MKNGLSDNPGILAKKSVRMRLYVYLTSLPVNLSLQTHNKGVLWNTYNNGYIGHEGDDPGVSTNILFKELRDWRFEKIWEKIVERKKFR